MFVTRPERDDTGLRLRAAAIELSDQTRWLLAASVDDVSGNDADESSSSDDETDGRMLGLVRSVKHYIDCLVDLGTALNCPALEPEQDDRPSPVPLQQRSAHDYHTDLIRAKFPNAELCLLQSLGKTSWHRYQRMRRERELNAEAKRTVLLSNKSQAAESSFHDSGLGTSLARPPSSYAETLLSFVTHMSEGRKIGVPPLPAEARNGQRFECTACGKLITAGSNREWRSAVLTQFEM
jgi:hypothetical protein